MASLLIALMSCPKSTIRSFLQRFVKRISPIAPSVKAGQKTGILFFHAQQYILYLLFIFSPIFAMILLGVQIYPLFFCSLQSSPNNGSKKLQSLIQFQLVTKIFPILQWPLSRFCLSSIWNDPSLKLSMHFIMSYSIPPAEVTMQSTILCSTRYLIVYLIPDDTILDVYPKNILVLVDCLYLGSFVYSSSFSVMGSSESLQSIILLMIFIALAKFVACKPVVEYA